MAHDLFDVTNDAYYSRLAELALAFPEAQMKVSHGAPVFFTKKTFAQYVARVKGGRHFPHALVFRPAAEEVPVYEADSRFFVPAYWGPYGWRAIDLAHGGTAPEDVDWSEVTDILETSYRQTAPARLVKHLPGLET